MAEEIINIEIVEEVENINIVVEEIIEDVTITIQEPSKTSDLVNDGADGVHPFITLEDIPTSAQDLQSVTDNGNHTTNDIIVENEAYYSLIQPSDIGTENKTTGSYTYLGGDGEIGIKTNNVEGVIKTTNLSNGLTLEFPDKVGSKTIATTEDIPSITGLATTIYVDNQDALKVDKITGKGLSTNDYTTAEQTKLSGIQAGAEVNINADWNATSGDAQILNKPTIPSTTNLVPYTGANSDVDLGTKNLKVNNVFEGFTSVTASGTQIVLITTSTPSYLVTGSGGQTIKLPNATTLQNGAIFDFNNNQSSGVISVNNNSNTLVKSIPSGGYLVLTLIDNSTSAGSWDAHFQAPSNVSWSTNTFDVPASITSATWNGVSIADNRIASATTWNAKEDSSNKVTTFIGNETSTIKFPVVKAILDYFSAANIKTILGITILSGSNTGDQDLSGYVPTTRTINSKALSSNITLTTADIADSTGKRYQTENQNSYNDATSSIQTQLNSRLLGVHTIKKPYTGQKILPIVNANPTAAALGVANRLIAIPYIPNISYTSADLYINILTLLAASNARILIYSDLNFSPDQKLYESANLDCSTIGIKTATTSFSFVAGTVYWLCVHSSSTQTFTGLNPIGLMCIGSSGTAFYTNAIITPTFGSAPTTFGTPSYNSSVTPYLVGITPA